jgi:hypothetical protein
MLEYNLHWLYTLPSNPLRWVSKLQDILEQRSCLQKLLEGQSSHFQICGTEMGSSNSPGSWIPKAFGSQRSPVFSPPIATLCWGLIHMASLELFSILNPEEGSQAPGTPWVSMDRWYNQKMSKSADCVV